MYVKKDSGLAEVVERGGPQDICAEGDYMMSVERRGKTILGERRELLFPICLILLTAPRL